MVEGELNGYYGMDVPTLSPLLRPFITLKYEILEKLVTFIPIVWKKFPKVVSSYKILYVLIELRQNKIVVVKVIC